VFPVDERVQLDDEPVHVGGMKAGGGLVEDIKRVPALDPLELVRELDALRFAGELFRRAAERVAKQSL